MRVKFPPIPLKREEVRIEVSIKKDISIRFILPVIEGIFLLLPFTGIGYFASIIFKLDKLYFTALFALVCSTYFWLHEFSSKKPWSFPTKLKERSGITYNLQQNHTTQILLTSNGGKTGEYFYLKGWDLNFLQRFAFLVTYGNGKITHGYLRDNFNFKRGTIEKFQYDLLKENLAELKNPKDKTRGVILKSKGVEVFHQLAKRYRPTPLDKETIKPYLKTYTIARTT